jgi:hypothetical protein
MIQRDIVSVEQLREPESPPMPIWGARFRVCSSDLSRST